MRIFYAFKKLLFLIPVLLIWHSCKHEPIDIDGFDPNDPNPTDSTDTLVNQCSPDTVYFENHILPIFIGNCISSGCHNTDDAREGVILDNYDDIMEEIDPGDHEESEIYDRITDEDEDDRMPYQLPPLSPDEIDKIRTWINQGALNNSCDAGSVDCDTSNVTYSNDIASILQNKGCVGCHNGGNASNGNVDLRSYASVKAVAEDNDRLFGAINHEDNYEPMPKNLPKLDDCLIITIKAWINQELQE